MMLRLCCAEEAIRGCVVCTIGLCTMFIICGTCCCCCNNCGCCQPFIPYVLPHPAFGTVSVGGGVFILTDEWAAAYVFRVFFQ